MSKLQFERVVVNIEEPRSLKPANLGSKRGLMPAKSLPLTLARETSAVQDDLEFRQILSRTISANLEAKRLNMMGEKISLSEDDISAMTSSWHHMPRPTRHSASSLTSQASSLENPFIMLMRSESSKMRKWSAETTTSIQSRKSSKKMSELCSQLSMPDEIEMQLLSVPVADEPSGDLNKPLPLLSPRSRPKSPRNQRAFDPAVRRKIAKAKQIKHEDGGSKIFENYQNLIFERTTTNPSVQEQSPTLNLLSSPSVKSTHRRSSWNAEAAEGSEAFKRLTAARSTWTGSTSRRPPAAQVTFQSVDEVTEEDVTGKRAHLKRGFQKLGRIFK